MQGVPVAAGAHGCSATQVRQRRRELVNSPVKNPPSKYENAHVFPRNHRWLRGRRNRGSTNGTREHTARCVGRGMNSTSPGSRRRHSVEQEQPVPAAARRGCEGRRSAARRRPVCVWETASGWKWRAGLAWALGR